MPRLSKKQIIAIVIALAAIALGLSRTEVLQIKALITRLEQTQPGQYHVLQIDDGDTITVAMNGQPETVRMIGVDTPETHHPNKPVQCFGKAATRFTRNLIGDSTVRLVADPLDDNRDIYGRLLRYVYLPDGTLVNAELITHGYGFAYTHFPFEKKPRFIKLERHARMDQRGLWSACKLQKNQYGTLETAPVG